MSKETALAKVGSYAMFKDDSKQVAAIMKENLGAQQLGVGDLDKVTVPGGGKTQWAIPGLEGEEYVKEIIGVPIHLADSRRYWEKSMDEGMGTAPDCSSSDKITGHGSPGGECAACPLKDFGPDGERPMCRERKTFYLMRENDVLPLVVDFAPTALKAIRQFMSRLVRHPSGPIIYWQTVIGISLEKDKSAAGMDYSKPVFRLVQKLSPEECTKLGPIKEQFAQLLGTV